MATDYQPPVADYAFLYREAFGTDIVARATGGELTADDGADIIAGAGEFAASVLAPLEQVGDREGARLVDGQVHLPDGFAEAYAAFVEAGWVTAEAPASAGGDGLPGSIRAGLGEIWNASNAAFALCWLLSAGQIHALDAAASDELREIYLAKLVSGEWTGTMNLTEPAAGTDLGAIRTTATPRDDGSWSIKGQKIFITWGDHDVAENIVHLVLARTPGAPEGAKGLSLFVAPKYLVNADGSLGDRNGVETVAIEHKLGIHGSPTCVLSYEDATGYLVGEVGGGLAGMFVMMNSARIGMGFQATGIADRALQQAEAYAADRMQGRVLERGGDAPIAEHPDVRRLLLSIRSDVFAMRALGVYVGDLFDRAEASEDAADLAFAEFFVPILKGWATEDAVALTSDAIQVHGGMGFIEETGAAQHWRDSRITTIYEGTTGIQANDLIFRKLMRDQGATAQAVLSEVQGTADALLASDRPELRAIGAQLLGAKQAWSDATEWVLGTVRSDVAAVLTAALPYLNLAVLVCGGWMMGRAALAAAGYLDSEAGDQRFYRSKIATAGFYADQLLAQAEAWSKVAMAGDAAIRGFGDVLFE